MKFRLLNFPRLKQIKWLINSLKNLISSYVAQAPFTTTWNDDQRIQRDSFASSAFDSLIDGGSGAVTGADAGAGISVGGSNNIIGTQPR